MMMMTMARTLLASITGELGVILTPEVNILKEKLNAYNALLSLYFFASFISFIANYFPRLMLTIGGLRMTRRVETSDSPAPATPLRLTV